MQFQIPSVSKLVALAILAASALPAFAQSAGNTLVHVGWFHIVPQDSSVPLQITSPFQTTIPGSGATVQSADTPGFSITRFLSDNWAASVDLGLPPKVRLDGTGTLSIIGRIGTARQWAPAVLGKYYFGDAHSKLRASLGLGVTHLSYTNIELTNSFQRFAGGAALDINSVTTAKLHSAWAPVFSGGLSYAINDDWYLNFSVSYVRVKSKGDITTVPTNPLLSTVKSTTTLTLNPIVTYLNVAYRF